MAQATRFADAAVRSVRWKSRSVRDARMFLQAAPFVYESDAPVCTRVFRLPHTGRWRLHEHVCRVLAARDAHLLKSGLLRPRADGRRRRLREHRWRIASRL